MKKDQYKTKTQLLTELDELRQRISSFEKSERQLKRAEKISQESEERFRLLYERTPLGYQSLDENGNFIEVNQAWLDLLGYSQEEIIGRWFGDFLAPQYEERFRENFPRFKAAGEIRDIEFEMVRKDGSHILVSFNGKIGYDEEGNFKQTHCILHDITERKKAEEALQRSDVELKRTLEATTDGIWTWNFKSDELTFSSRYYEMLGYKPNEFPATFENWKSLIHPDDLENAVGVATEYLKTKSDQYENEFRLRTKTGEYRWIHARARVVERDGDGEAVYMIGNHEDITERKNVEKALRDSEERFRYLSDATFEAIVIHDKGVLLRANNQFFQMFGYELYELLGEQFIPLIVAPESREFVKEQIPSRELEPYEIMGMMKDGSKLILEIRVREMEYEGRTVRVSAIRDITERKRTEEKLRAYRDELRSLASELSLAEERERRRLATELHDSVGQILAVSKVKLGSLRKASEDREIEHSIDEIQDLMDQAIQHTRTLTFELSPPILYELGLESAIEWLTDQIQEQHGIQILYEDDDKKKPLNEDIRVVLFQAVRELFINIVKHAQAHKAKVTIRRVENTIRVEVEDDGIGIDKSKIDVEKGEVKGFGLFNIRERLKLLGGHVALKSDPGIGTRVSLIAPLALEEKKE